MSAYRIEVLTDSRLADEDLSAKQYFCVSPTATGVDLSDLQGEQVVGIHGILMNKPAANEHAEIAVQGICPASAGGTLALWDRVTCDSAGELIRARPGDYVIGRALEAAVDGDQFPLLITHEGNPYMQYFTADDDLTSSAGYAVTVHTDAGEVDLAANGEAAIGIVLAGVAAAAAVKVQTFGVCQAVAGTSGVTVGDLLGTEAGGKVVTAASGDYVIGRALASINADATGTIFFHPGAGRPT